MSSVEQEIVAAAREVAALFVEHPFVPRTWAEVQRFVAAVARADAPAPAPGAAPERAAPDDGPTPASLPPSSSR